MLLLLLIRLVHGTFEFTQPLAKAFGNIGKFLPAKEKNGDEQNHQYARVLRSVYGDGKRPFELATANSLWGQKGYHFKVGFQEAIADFYDGALHVVNFRAQPDEAVRAINAWVSDKTREKIRELVRRDFS